MVRPPALHRIVHRSRGRIRVHLRQWAGADAARLAARLRSLGGVTAAEANPLTRNVLVLFDAGRVDPESVLAGLSAIPLNAPAEAPFYVAAQCLENGLPAERRLSPAATTGRYVTGVRRVVYRLLGWGMVGLAVVGVIMPGIPAEPFVILAGYFFVRSSPAAHRWLLRLPWLGRTLAEWEEHRAVRRSFKLAVAALMGLGAVVVTWLGFSWPILLPAYLVQLLFLVVVIRLPVIQEPAAVFAPTPPPVGYVTGVRRIIYQGLGWGSVGMAVVGAITPGIPALPFVILAGYFFIRSSPEAHQWLRQSSWFGPMLRDWEEHRAIRPAVRNVLAVLLAVSVVLTGTLSLPLPLRIGMLIVQGVMVVVVLRIPVVDPHRLEGGSPALPGAGLLTTGPLTV